MFNEKCLKWIKICLLAIVISGCGLKGPLYQTPEPEVSQSKEQTAEQNQQ
jgi:predicted small lipoprotein YifL